MLTARQIAAKFSLYLDFRRTSKSLATHPCNRPCVAKHMLLCLHGLRRLDKFIITWQSLPVYRDFVILTTIS